MRYPCLFLTLLIVSARIRNVSAFAFFRPATRASISPALHSLPVDGTEVARLVQPSVALVTPISVRNSTARGSGFVIQHGEDDEFLYLLTAAHVAAPGLKIEISFPGDDRSRAATVLGRSNSTDLALIRVDRSERDPVALAICPDTPQVGSIAFAHGYPASRMRGPAMTCGMVCGIADGLGVPDDPLSNQTTNSGASFVVTDAAMSGGMSGGPLVDLEGTVLGVNALIRPDLRALGNYAVSADEIRLFVQNVGNDDTTQADGPFRVVLFNDRMNKRARVAQILKNVAALEEETANNVMMEAHTKGRGVVKEFDEREGADELCRSLRQEDILVEVEK